MCADVCVWGVEGEGEGEGIYSDGREKDKGQGLKDH